MRRKLLTVAMLVAALTLTLSSCKKDKDNGDENVPTGQEQVDKTTPTDKPVVNVPTDNQATVTIQTPSGQLEEVKREDDGTVVVPEVPPVKDEDKKDDYVAVWKDDEGNTYKEGDIVTDDMNLHIVYEEKVDASKLEEYFEQKAKENPTEPIPVYLENFDGNFTNLSTLLSKYPDIKVDLELAPSEDLKTISGFNSQNVRTLIIPDGVTTIEGSAYTNLESVRVPGTVSEVRDGLFQNAKLTTVILEDGIESIGHSAFAGCPDLKTVVLPNSIKSFGNNILDGTKVETFRIPGSVKELNSGVFSKCPESLQSITISDGVEKLGDGAFTGAKNVKAFSVPASVTYIGGGAFGSGSVEELYLNSTEVFENVNTFGLDKDKVTIYVANEELKAKYEEKNPGFKFAVAGAEDSSKGEADKPAETPKAE